MDENTTKSTSTQSAAKKTSAAKSATAKSTASKTSAAKTTAAKSGASKSTAAKSATPKTATAGKSTAAKTTAKTAASKPAATETAATTSKPAATKSTASKSTVSKSTANKSSVSKSAATKSATNKTATTKKATDEIGTVNAAAEEIKTEETTIAAQAEVAADKSESDSAVKAEEIIAEKADTEMAESVAVNLKSEEDSARSQDGYGKEFDEEEERKEREARDEKAKADALLPPDPDALLEVRHLKKYFVINKNLVGKPTQFLRAVDDVSFKLKKGETLGIVGESGCGKTTLGRTILKLYQPSGGQVFFNGEDIAGFKSKQMRKLRTKMQIIFQDPYSSLPPRSTVGGILSEPVKVHKIVPKAEIKDYVLDIMEKCGLRDYYYERYPHEFSGGQRQRICIARALSVNPQLVVCDEPVSALDVSIQAQIINLLKDLQNTLGLTYLFISHDLSVVKHISDRIGVMYLGSMVEFGDKKNIFGNPLHPYTQALFSAVPNPNPDVKMNRIVLKGDIPSPANPPKGCKFHTRCPKAMEICSHIAPVYKEYEPGHFAACHLYSQD